MFALHHAGDPFTQRKGELAKNLKLKSRANQRIENFAEATVPAVAVKEGVACDSIRILALEVERFFRKEIWMVHLRHSPTGIAIQSQWMAVMTCAPYFWFLVSMQ